MQTKDFSQVFSRFKNLRILVVGDVMVDAYLFGKVDRISPEAPVPIVTVEKRVNRLGGAANVALNLKALGVTPLLCAVTGQDQKGDEFRQLLEDEQISSDYILRSPYRITTTKFRVIGNNTQMLRVDEEFTHDIQPDDEKLLLTTVDGLVKNRSIDAVILQDYNKGVLTPVVIRELISMADQAGIPVIVDPKKKNFHLYSKVTLFKPNLKELREGLNMEIDPAREGDLEKAAGALHDEQQIRLVMITLSDAGVFISEAAGKEQKRSVRIAAHRRSIADVSGAGDTVVSVAAACLASGMPSQEVASVANLAGGLVCEEVGVVPINLERLKAEVKRLETS